MAKRRRRVKSTKRGGAGAPPACKRALSTCMNTLTCGSAGGVKGGSLKLAGRRCMAAFNRCRSGRRGRR